MPHHPSPASTAKLSLKVAVLGGVLFLGFLALGYYGWMETLRKATGGSHRAESLFNTVELVTGEVAVVVDHIHNHHWALLVAKWGIKTLLAVAIFQSGIYIFRRQLRRWKFRKVSGHQVFLGLAASNQELVRLALADGGQVAVIDNDEHHPNRTALESRGVLFLCGSPLDQVLLRTAGVARAKRVVVGTGNDEKNAAAAEQVAALVESVAGKSVEVLVPIECPKMRELLRERWELLAHSGGFHIRLVGFRPVALRHILTQLAKSLANLSASGGRGPRILLAAPADFALELLELAVPFLQVTGAVLPCYDICGVADQDARRFLKQHPDLDLVAKVTFHPESVEDAPLADGLAGSEFDVGLVHLDSEAATLAAADSILRSRCFRVERVVGIIHSPAQIHLKPDARLEILSLFAHGMNAPEFGDHSLEQLAKDNHEAYLTGLEAKERATAPSWQALGEAAKDSNRWAVLHRNVKLAIWQNAADADKPILLELLASSEHQRWMGEKIMDGWSGGVSRDDFHKIHPDIRPYADLSEPAKEKDRVQVRKALGLKCP